MTPTQIANFIVVDPHYHLWDLERASYPWLNARPSWSGICGDITDICRSYLLADYIKDHGRWKVSQSVHVEAGYDEHDPVGESRWIQGIADKHKMPDAMVAAAALHQPDVERVLAQHHEYANVRGVRHSIYWHVNPEKSAIDCSDLMTHSAWTAGFALLKKYDLSFDLSIYPSQMQDAARLAACHPKTSLILNHTGMPIDRDESGLALWHQGMKTLAAQPNVSLKISGLGMVDWKWSTESIRPFVLGAIDYFGVDRCMFASNFPVDRLYSSFETLFDAYAEIVQDFTYDEQRRLFGATAARIYRLNDAIR
jgi:predicted TIM-barrel fold metal-dependent hydrolase